MSLYIHNKYTQYTHILCKQKLLFWMRLIAINRLTAHTYTYIYTHIHIYIYIYIYILQLVIKIINCVSNSLRMQEWKGKAFCRIGDFYCSMSMSVRARSWSNPSRHHSGGVTCVLVTFIHRTKENGSRKTENTPFHRNQGNRQPATFNVLKTSDWTACQNIKAHLWRPKSHLWKEGGLFYLTNDFLY